MSRSYRKVPIVGATGAGSDADVVANWTGGKMTDKKTPLSERLIRFMQDLEIKRMENGQ